MISSKTVCTSMLVMFAVIIIKTNGFNFEDRVMSDCRNAGFLCSNFSACKFDLNKNNFTCFCRAGYKGDLCDEDRNECKIGSAPCKKRGVCHNSIGSFRCDCLPGWTGSHCQQSDGSGQSVCLTGYTGVNCTEDFDECAQWQDNPCEHGSTCTNTPGNFSCSCTTGWAGRICNEDINECNLTSGLCHNGGNCTNIPGTYRCDCLYPYTGPACDDVSSTTSTTTSTSTTPTLFSSTERFNASTNPRSNDSLTKSKNRGQIKTIVGTTVGSICGALLICVAIIGAWLYHKHNRVQQKVGTTNVRNFKNNIGNSIDVTSVNM